MKNINRYDNNDIIDYKILLIRRNNDDGDDWSEYKNVIKYCFIEKYKSLRQR